MKKNPACGAENEMQIGGYPKPLLAVTTSAAAVSACTVYVVSDSHGARELVASGTIGELMT